MNKWIYRFENNFYDENREKRDVLLGIVELNRLLSLEWTTLARIFTYILAKKEPEIFFLFTFVI